MNKIKGKQIAVARVVYKDDKPELQRPLSMLISPLEVEASGVKESALEDCCKQLEKMGSFKKLSLELNGGHGNEEGHPGLVIRSKEDPRLVCSVEFGSKWQKDSDLQFVEHTKCDLTLKFFLDNFGEEGKELVPEYPLPQDALEYIENLRKEESLFQPGMNALKKGLVEDVSNQMINEMAGLVETGEADQDYDHDFYGAVCKAIGKLGYKCKHKEFDKYQGIYIDVAKGSMPIARLWTVDSYVVGKKNAKTMPKYAQAYLLDKHGKSSATRGDYFMMDKDEVFKNTDLVLVAQDGTKKVIKNPKVKDLPDLKDVGFGEYEGEPDDVLVVEPEGHHEKGMEAEIRVTPKGKVDLGQLPEVLKELEKGKAKEKTMESKFGTDVMGVDFFGLPKLDEASEVYKPSFSEVKDADIMPKEPEKKEKEVEKKEDKLSGQEEPNKAGEAIAKPESELKGDNKPVSQGALESSKVKVGDPGDAHGDHVEGKGSSDDQQKDLAGSEVKVGKPGDDHGKHVAEAVERTEKRIQEGRRNQEAIRKRIEEARTRAMKRFEEEKKKSETAIAESATKTVVENKVEDKQGELDTLTKDHKEMGEMEHEVAKMKEAYEAKMQEAAGIKEKIDAHEKKINEMKMKQEAEKSADAKEAPKADAPAAEAPKSEDGEKKAEEKPEVDEASKKGKAMPAAVRSKLAALMKKRHKK